MPSRTISAVIPVLNLTDNVPLQLSLSRPVFRFDADGNSTPENQSSVFTAYVGQGLDASRVTWTATLADGSAIPLNPASRLLGVRKHAQSLGDTSGTDNDDFIVSDVRYAPDQVISNVETLIEGVGARSLIEAAWPVSGGFQVGHNDREVEEYSVAADGTVAHVARRADIPQGLSPSNNIATAWYDEDSSTWTVINRDGTIRTKVGNGGIRQHANFTVNPALALGLASDDTFLVSTRTGARLYQLQIPDKNIVSNAAPVLRTTLTGVPEYARILGAGFHIGGIVRVAENDYVVMLDGGLWQVTLDGNDWDLNQIGSLTSGARFTKPLLMLDSLTARPFVRYISASDMGDEVSATVTATLGQHQDSQTILRVQDGDPAIVVSATNDTITLTQSDEGRVSSFSGATGQLNVHKGLRLLDPADYNSSMVTSAGITATYDHATRAYAVTSITEAQAEGMLTFTVTVEGQEYTRIVTVRKGNLGQRSGRNASRQIADGSVSVFDASVAPMSDGSNGLWWRKAAGPIDRVQDTDDVVVLWDDVPNSDDLPAVLAADGTAKSVWRVRLLGTQNNLHPTGRAIININPDNTDLTTDAERDLRFAFKYKDRTVALQIEDDFTDPYDWTPNDAADRTALTSFAEFVAADADRATQNIDMVILDGSDDSPVDFTGLTVTVTATWSDAEANAAIAGDNVISDVVTLYNDARTFAETRTWDGDNWVAYNNRFAGNVFVDGSIVGRKIAAHTITATEIRSDVYNVDVLWEGGIDVPEHGSATSLDVREAADNPRTYDLIQLALVAKEVGNNQNPNIHSVIGGHASSLLRPIGASTGSRHLMAPYSATQNVSIRVVVGELDERILKVSRGTQASVTLYAIVGLRRPSA